MKRKVRIVKKGLGQAKNGVNIGLDNYFQGKMQKDPGINQFGAPDLQVNRTLSAVPRDKANIEAEGGEFAMVPGEGGIPETYTISGPRHAQGGVPLSLSEKSFIWSDTKSMKIGGDTLSEFGFSTKKKLTPAKIAKKYDNNPWLKVLRDSYSDDWDIDTAEQMIKNNTLKLGKLGLVQESMKGFPQGIPDVSVPYLQSMGIDPNQIAPQQENEQPMAAYGAGVQGDPHMYSYRNGGSINKKQNKRFPGLSIAQNGEEQNYNFTISNPNVIAEQEQSPFYASEDDYSNMLDAIRGWRYSGSRNAPATPEQIDAMRNWYPIHREGEDVSYTMMPEGVSPDLSGYKAGGEAFKPHMMFDPSTGKSMLANTYADHLMLQNKGWGHENDMPKRKVRVRRGGAINAFNDGYGSVNFGNAALGKFIPTYQSGGQSTTEVSKKQAKKLQKESDKLYQKVYKNWLKKEGLDEDDLPYAEWSQEMASNDPDYITNEVKRLSTPEYKRLLKKAGKTIDDVVNKVIDTRGKDKSGTIQFDSPTYTPRVTSDGVTTSDRKIVSTKTVKKQNVPKDKVAASKEEVTDEMPYYKGDNGVYYKAVKFEDDVELPKGYEKTFGTTENGKTAAINYYRLEERFKNKEFLEEFAAKAKEAMLDPKSYIGKTGRSSTMMDKAKIEAMTPEQIAAQFLRMQKRNLAMVGHGKQSGDYTDAPTQGGIISVGGGRTSKALQDEYKKYGVELTNEDDIRLQQGAYRGYAKLLNTDYSDNPEMAKLLKPFKIAQTGAKDEPGYLGGKAMSPIDGDYTDTSTFEVAGYTPQKGSFEEAEWTETEEKIEKDVPEKYVPPTIPKPAAWWAQDVGNIMDLARTRYTIPNIQEIDTGVDLMGPRVSYLSDISDQARLRGYGKDMTDYLQAYAGPQSTFQATKTFGDLLDKAAGISANVRNRNVDIANRYMTAATDTANREALLDREARDKLNREQAIRRQQLWNSKNLASRNLFEGWRQGLTNKWQTQTMNELFPQFYVDPAVGGQFHFWQGRPYMQSDSDMASNYGSDYLSNVRSLKDQYGDEFTEEEYREAAKQMSGNRRSPRRGSPYQGANEFYDMYSGVTGPWTT